MARRIFFILSAWLCIILNWDVKNVFAYVLQFFSLISNGLGGVTMYKKRLSDQGLRQTDILNIISI